MKLFNLLLISMILISGCKEKIKYVDRPIDKIVEKEIKTNIFIQDIDYMYLRSNIFLIENATMFDYVPKNRRVYFGRYEENKKAWEKVRLIYISTLDFKSEVSDYEKNNRNCSITISTLSSELFKLSCELNHKPQFMALINSEPRIEYTRCGKIKVFDEITLFSDSPIKFKIREYLMDENKLCRQIKGEYWINFEAVSDQYKILEKEVNDKERLDLIIKNKKAGGWRKDLAEILEK